MIRHEDGSVRISQMGRLDVLHLHRLGQLLDDNGAEEVRRMFLGSALLYILSDPAWYGRDRTDDGDSVTLIRVDDLPVFVNVQHDDLVRVAGQWTEYEPVMGSVWAGRSAADMLAVLRAHGVRCDLSQVQRAVCAGQVDWDEALAAFRLCSAEDWPTQSESLRVEAERLAQLVAERLMPVCVDELARTTDLVVDEELLDRLAETIVLAATHAAGMARWYLGPSRGRRFGPFLTFAQASNLACRALPGRRFCGRAIDWMYRRAPGLLSLDVVSSASFERAVRDVMIECDGYVD